MDDTLTVALARWGNFYLIIGGAAASLTGLQFVVQTLLTSSPIKPVAGSDPEATMDAFGTPTVVHFTVALVISALMCIPWPGLGSMRATLAIIGTGAMIYSVIVMRRARRQRGYVPVAEDWIWHVLLPGAAYAAVLVSAALLADSLTLALFPTGMATLLLVCVGIHNAWDTVTYLALKVLRNEAAHADPTPPRRDKHGGPTHSRK